MEIYTSEDIKKGLPSLKEFDEVNNLVIKTILNSEYFEFIKAFFHYGSFSWGSHNVFSDLDYYVLWDEDNRDKFDAFAEQMSKISTESCLKIMFRLKDKTDFLEEAELFRIFCIKELLEKDGTFFSGLDSKDKFINSLPNVDFDLVYKRLVSDINGYIKYIENINIENVNEKQLRVICKFPLKVVRDYLIYMTKNDSFKYPEDVHHKLVSVYSVHGPDGATRFLNSIFQIQEDYKDKIISLKNNSNFDEEYKKALFELIQIINPINNFLKENLAFLKTS